MISNYTIHNFKNHAQTSLSFKHLTLLTGINGAGKSSVIQSFLLLRDSYYRSHNLDNLYFKGTSFDLGRSFDAVNANCKDRPDELELDIDDYKFVYKYPSDNTSSLKALKSGIYTEEKLNKLSLFNNDFQYLSAFREGPQTSYGSDTDIVDEHRQLSSKMGWGDMAVYFLSKFGNESLYIPQLCYNEDTQGTFRAQTELWMNEISNGLQIKIDQDGNQYKLSLGYQIEGAKTRFYSAINTGFGISYILAVVVAVLSAKPGALLLIENPEAHIHPSGQAALMRLISKAAANGVQIIMETHSDHIVNGALVNRKQGVLQDDNLAVYYFNRDEFFNASPHSLEIADDGRIKNAPQGFFDQMNADLDVLFDL